MRYINYIKNRIGLIITLILLVFIGDTVYKQNKYSKRYAGILLFPERPVLIEGDVYNDYIIPGLDVKAVGIDGPSLIVKNVFVRTNCDSLRNQLSLSGVFEDKPPQNSVSALFHMDARGTPMCLRMSQYTDDLAYHDCLYYPVLDMVYYGNLPVLPVIENETNSCFLNKCVDGLAKIELLIRKKFCKEIQDYSTITQSEEASYSIVFNSNRDALKYAFTTIQGQEKDWNLFYYPTLLIGTEETECVLLAENEEGKLYRCTHCPLSSTVTYVRLGSGFYVRVLFGHNQKKNEIEDIQIALQEYDKVTQTMNDLVQEYFAQL